MCTMIRDAQHLLPSSRPPSAAHSEASSSTAAVTVRSARERYPASAAWAGVGPSDSWRAVGSVAGEEGRGTAAVADAGVVATRACDCGCSCATT